LLILATLMEAICSSETSVLTRATWYHIQEDSSLNWAHIFNYTSDQLFQMDLRFS
jgi:hypothetical protein